MTRYLALPVVACACGREMIAFHAAECEVCRGVREARIANGRRIGAALDSGLTVGQVAARLGVEIEVVQDRIAEAWR